MLYQLKGVIHGVVTRKMILHIINTSTPSNSDQFFVAQFHTFSLCHGHNHFLHDGCINLRVQSRVRLRLFR